MEPQEVDRAIQFLLAQQAQFAGDLQQSRELSDRRHGQLTEALMRLVAVQAHADSRQAQFDSRIEAIDRRLEAIARKHEELAEAHKETQANLSSLMLVVEKYFRDRTNGGGSH